MYTPDVLLTLEEKKHDVGIDPHIIAPDPDASYDILNVPLLDYPSTLTRSTSDTMNPGDDESSTSLNVRLRPRKPPNTTQVPKTTLRKSDDKNAMPKGTNALSKDKDLVDKADFPLSHQYLCIYCEKNFSSKQAVSKHVRRIHSSSNQKQHYLAKCIFCSHTEADLNNIIKHMLDSHSDDYFACLDCHTRLSSARELKEHKLNLCENRKETTQLKTPQRNTSNIKKNKRTPKHETKSDLSKIEKEVQDSSDFAGIVISCELKPAHVRDEEDIEDNITTNVILPRTKPLNNSAIVERRGLIVLDDLQWGRRISQGLSFHNTDADQILSRLGVVHRSPRTGESTKKESKATYDESTQKFEKCFDTNFYSKVASNVQENLAKYLDGSFNFKPDPENVVTTRRSKYSVTINTVEGFPILLACEQYSRNAFDAYLPRASALKHKWKWGNVEFDKSFLNQIPLTRDSHTSNCIISLVSSLDIWTQLRMRKKFDDIYNRFSKEKVNEKQNLLAKQLKEILESREISKPGQIVPCQNRQIPKGNKIDFSASLGLVPSSPQYKMEPAVLSGEWVRPRCYVCCACGAQTRDSRTLTSHISTQHPNAQVQHYEIVGELLLNSDILKHLYVPPSPVSNRTRPLRGFKECTKCNKSISLEDLHQHMLDCAGDTPAVRRKQCRYRLFGVRKRRPRLPDNTVRKKIRKDIRNGQKRQKTRMRPRQRIRSEVGDAETIRKMIADLPAKRQRVMINPHQISRQRRHLDRKRNKLAIKRRLSGELSKVKELRKNGDNNATACVKASIKSKLVRVRSTHQSNAIMNRKVVITRLKKKSIQAREQSEKISNENLTKETETSNNSCALDRQTENTFLKNASGNAKEHGNKNGSTNHSQHPSNDGGQNSSNNSNVPTQNTPLKHSIARLTASTEKHDKSVQFHHSFLVQQHFDINQTIKQFNDKSGPQILFENEEAATKPDKPPINLFQIEAVENRNKSKQNKPRKGLNDCIAMLKNKLTDVSQTDYVSVKCGSDDPLEPEVTSIQSDVQKNGKSDYEISPTYYGGSTSRRKFENEQISTKNTNENKLTKNYLLPPIGFSADNLETENQPNNIKTHDLPSSQDQPEIIQAVTNPLSVDLSGLSVRLAHQDIITKQEAYTSATASFPAQVLYPSHSTISNENLKIMVQDYPNKKQYVVENLVETCPKQQNFHDNYISKSQDIHFHTEKEKFTVDKPNANLTLFTTEIPMAHASTNVESIISTPLDLSLKVYTSTEIYSSVNNDDYETLDLSNKNIETMSLDNNVSEYVVDLSVKSTYKEDLRNIAIKLYSEHENIPTDLSSRTKPGTSMDTLNSSSFEENQIHKINMNNSTYISYSDTQDEIDSLSCRPIECVDVAELHSKTLTADYCSLTKRDRNIHDLVWNCTTGKNISSLERNYTVESTEQQLSGNSYKSIPVVANIPLRTEDYSNMRIIQSKKALSCLSQPQLDKSLQHSSYVQNESTNDLVDPNFPNHTLLSAQNTISTSIDAKVTSKDQSFTSVTPDENNSQTTSENNLSSMYVRSNLNEDYVKASSSSQLSYSGTESQLNSIKFFIEEEHNKRKNSGKDNIADNVDITKNMSVLPKELLEVLGKMPVDHRNQLLDILKQYISSSTFTISQYEAAKSYMCTAGLLPEKNIAMLNKLQTGDSIVTTTEPQASNQLNTSTNVSQSKTLCLQDSNKSSQGQLETIIVSKPIQTNISSDRVLDLTEDENIPHVKLPDTCLSADYSPTEKVVIQRIYSDQKDENIAHVKLPDTYLSAEYTPSEKVVKQRIHSDQTASLRAVRIKAPSERRKELKSINETDLKGASCNESETCEGTNEVLAIQQAEISSTQHGVKQTTDSQVYVPNEREPILEHFNCKTSDLNDKSSVDSEIINLKAAVVTSSVVSKELRCVSENTTSQKIDLPVSQFKETRRENNKEYEPTKTAPYQIEDENPEQKQEEIKNNTTEDDSEDDISLALIVKQKHSSQVIDCKSKTNISCKRKNKRKMKKANKSMQKHQRQRKNDKLMEANSSNMSDLSKNGKDKTPFKDLSNESKTSQIIETNKETKNNDDKTTTDKTLKIRKTESPHSEGKNGTQPVAAINNLMTNESLPKSEGDVRKEETEFISLSVDKSQVEILPVTNMKVENSTNHNNFVKPNVDLHNPVVDNKSNRKTHRSKKSIVTLTESKNSILEESVPLRRSRRGKSLIFDDTDKNRPEILESKPLLTKKQLIFSKLLLDNEVLHNTDLSSDGKSTVNNDLTPNAKGNLNKNVESLNININKSFQNSTSSISRCTDKEETNLLYTNVSSDVTVGDVSKCAANKTPILPSKDNSTSLQVRSSVDDKDTSDFLKRTFDEYDPNLKRVKSTRVVSTEIVDSDIINTSNKSTEEVQCVSSASDKSNGEQLSVIPSITPTKVRTLNVQNLGINNKSESYDAEHTVDENSALLMSVKLSSATSNLTTMKQSSTDNYKTLQLHTNNDKTVGVVSNRHYNTSPNLECENIQPNQILNEKSNLQISDRKHTAGEECNLPDTILVKNVSKQNVKEQKNILRSEPSRDVSKQSLNENLPANYRPDSGYTESMTKSSPDVKTKTTNSKRNTNEKSKLLSGVKHKNARSEVSSQEKSQSSSVKSATDVLMPNIDKNLKEFRSKKDLNKESSSIEKETPSIVKEILSIENKSPSIDKETLSVENETPCIEKENLSIEKETPSIEKETSCIEKESPSIEKENPSIEKESPSIEKENPSIEKESPSIEKESASLEKESPRIEKAGKSIEKESPIIELAKNISKTSTKTGCTAQQNSKTCTSMESDSLIVYPEITYKKKKSTDKQRREHADNALDLPIAARRARSKSVVVKTSYDPYDIEMGILDEETQPLTSLLRVKEKRKSNLTLFRNKTMATDPSAIENDLRKRKKIENTSLSTKSRVKSEKKGASHKSVKEDNQDTEENAIYSDDSTKSDVPLQKYVKEKKNADSNKRSQKDIEFSKSKLVKTNNYTQSEDKQSNDLKCVNSLETEEQLRSEQFMESFGFFSQRKPRKSNLLATKKISATFHSISVESDDAIDTPKNRATKKNTQPNDETKKSKRGRKKKEPIAMTTCYCMICKKEFRRPDNYVRHQMTLLHVSKLCEVELNVKTPPIVEETNYLIAYKNELDKIKKQTEEGKRLNKEVIIPSLEEILVQVHKSVRAQQLSRRGLSRDEALFLDCCELLKKSHKNDLHEKNPGSIVKDVDNIALPQCSIPVTNYTHEVETEDKNDLRSDGDVDSITAKNILESEEVRNLENDLICGLKEAAEMNSRKELNNENISSIPVSFDNALIPDCLPSANQSHDFLSRNDTESCVSTMSNVIDIIKTVPLKEETSNNVNLDSETHQDSNNISVETEIPPENKETEDVSKDEVVDNVSGSDLSKIKKPHEVKDKMYPDIDNIDIFEDKFDKIKRKCRSQAAAARQSQITLESTSRDKEKKRTDKTKLKRFSKKKQHNTILTKGALKGFDNVKESVTSSQPNISTEIQGENYQLKKKRRSGTKKKKDKRVNKDENNDTGLNESSSGQKKIDVYEFMDNDEAELFEFRPSTLMERFKNISNKDLLTKEMPKPNLSYEDGDGFTSESGSDGDDFVYMSDDYVVGSDNETENSVISCETENGTEIKKTVQRKKEVTEKNAVMGKIFKNNAVRSEKRLAKYRESAKHKANLDKLFDSLLSEEPTTIRDDPDDNVKEQASSSSLDSCNTVKNKQDDNFSPPKENSVRKRKRSSNFTEKDRDFVSPKKSNVSPSRTYDDSNYGEKLPYDTSFLTEEKKAYIDDDSLLDKRGVAPQRARRKCTVGKQNVLAETWSSESEPDGAPSRPNSVESDTTVVGRKRKVKKKETNTSSNRRNKQQISIKKQDTESRLHKSNRIRPTTSAKTRGKSVNDTNETLNEGKRVSCTDDPYHMPIASTSGLEGSSKVRARTSSYYWSGEVEEEQEHQQQHGWIVGDSHKKLVTMLAHAKGRKRNYDNSLVD